MGDKNNEGTRLVRLDIVLTATVQLEVQRASSKAQAREQALRTLNSAIRRAESDPSVKLARQADEKLYDPSGEN